MDVKMCSVNFPLDFTLFQKQVSTIRLLFVVILATMITVQEFTQLSLTLEIDNSNSLKLTSDQVTSLFQQSFINQNKIQQPVTSASDSHSANRQQLSSNSLGHQLLLDEFHKIQSSMDSQSRSSVPTDLKASDTVNQRQTNTNLFNLLKLNGQSIISNYNDTISANRQETGIINGSRLDELQNKEQQIIKQLMSHLQETTAAPANNSPEITDSDGKSRLSIITGSSDSKELNERLKQLIMATSSTNNNSTKLINSREGAPRASITNSDRTATGESKSGLVDFVTNPIKDLAKGVLDLSENKKQAHEDEKEKEKSKSPVEKLPFGDMLKPLLMTLLGKKVNNSIDNKNGGKESGDKKTSESYDSSSQNKLEYRVTIETVDKKTNIE